MKNNQCGGMKSKRGVVLKIERKSNDYDYKGCPEPFQMDGWG
jgi:hypothetical protein